MRKYRQTIFCLFASSSFLFSQTIEEKLSFLEGISSQGEEKNFSVEKVNMLLSNYRKELREKYEEAYMLLDANAGEEEFRDLLEEINEVQGEIAKTEEHFRENQVKEIK